MKARYVIVLGAAVLALTGCSATKDTPEAAVPSVDPVPNPSGSFDADTLDATAAYLTELGKVDKKLVSNTRTALDNGMEVCVDVEERRTDAEQQKNVATRFAVDAKQAKRILELTKSNLCLQ